MGGNIKKPVYLIWGPELFDKVWSSTSFNKKQTMLISEALSACSKILDLGTGIGNVAKRLVELGKTVYGADINKEMLNYASSKINSSKFHPVLADVQKLNYSREFDGVSCASNMAYFDDLKRILRVVHRALRSGGLFVICGYEANKMQEWARLTGKESKKAIENGKIVLNDKELQKLQLSQESSLKTIDSSKRTRSALRKAGFNILKDEKFYQGTCYFILAQKDKK